MSKAVKIIIVAVLIVVVGAVIAVKQQGKNAVSEPAAAASSNYQTTTEIKPQNLENPNSAETTANLPRLVDLGMGKCIPCKMMTPILEKLKSQYQGKLEVVFIDVWEKPDEAKKYKINMLVLFRIS